MEISSINSPKNSTWIDKETHNIVKPQFECDAKFKKEIIRKKHLNTKHKNKKCMVCLVTFTDSMEVLKRVTKDHSKNVIEKISVKEKHK